MEWISASSRRKINFKCDISVITEIDNIASQNALSPPTTMQNCFAIYINTFLGAKESKVLDPFLKKMLLANQSSNT